VGEEHTSWVEVGESIQPVPIGRKRLFLAAMCRVAGQLLRCEVGSEVVCLAGEYYCAVALPEGQRLVPFGVTRRRNDPDTGLDLDLAGDFLVGSTREVDQLVDCVAAPACGGQFDVLHQDGLAAQERVPADVVEVQVTVHDHGNVSEGDSGRREGVPQRTAARPIARFGFGVCLPDSGIEEEQPVVVLHQVGKNGSTRGCGPPTSEAGRMKYPRSSRRTAMFFRKQPSLRASA
jgi:hypothetical protein